MSKTLSCITAGVLGALLTAGPALADLVVPEPATMSLFGIGAGAAVLINRLRRRK